MHFLVILDQDSKFKCKTRPQWMNLGRVNWVSLSSRSLNGGCRYIIFCLSQEVDFWMHASAKNLCAHSQAKHVYAWFLNTFDLAARFLSARRTNADGDSASKMCFGWIQKKRSLHSRLYGCPCTLCVGMCASSMRIMETHAWIGPSHRVSYHAYPRLSAVGAYMNTYVYEGKGLSEIAKKSVWLTLLTNAYRANAF